ncbi:hypothetical protein AAY473_026881 [Plecturocebus cupreus]
MEKSKHIHFRKGGLGPGVVANGAKGGWALGLMLVIPALWEAKAGGLRGQEFETSLANMLLKRLRQENCLNTRGRGCSEPRSCHCTPAWVTEQDSISGGKKRRWGFTMLAGLVWELLTSGDPSALASKSSEITGMSPDAQSQAHVLTDPTHLGSPEYQKAGSTANVCNLFKSAKDSAVRGAGLLALTQQAVVPSHRSHYRPAP